MESASQVARFCILDQWCPEGSTASISALQTRAIEISQELQFIERCTLSIADRQQAGQGPVEVPAS